MFDYKLQTPGIYEYSHIDRPVLFTEEFLSTLRMGNQLMVEDEHNGPKIADITDIFWRGDGLYLRTPTELKLGGRGLSTHLKDVELEAREDGTYLITGGVLQKVAITGNPKDKSTILYNGDTHPGGTVTITTPPTPSGGGGSSSQKSEGRETMTKEIRELEQEIGGLKNQLNIRIDENLAQKDRIKQLEQTLTEKDNEIQKLQDFKKDTEKQRAEKTALIAKEMAGDDEDLYNVYKDMTPTQLKVIQEKQRAKQHTGFKGTGDATSDPDGTGDDSKKKKKDDANEYTDDKGEPIPYEDWKKRRSGSGW